MNNPKIERLNNSKKYCFLVFDDLLKIESLFFINPMAVSIFLIWSTRLADLIKGKNLIKINGKTNKKFNKKNKKEILPANRLIRRKNDVIKKTVKEVSKIIILKKYNISILPFTKL